MSDLEGVEMREAYIGLDIGTTSIKVALTDKELNTLYEKQCSYDYLTPFRGWSEIDPNTWLEIVVEELKELFKKFPSENIRGIGITGQMHTTVFIDENNHSVRPAIMWNDNRTAQMLPELKIRLRKRSDTAHLSKIISTGSPLANILWVKKYEAKNYQKIKKVLIAKDYLVLKLTGCLATDFCDASTSSFFDLEKDRWSDGVFEEFDLPETLLPEIYPASQVIGSLTENIQELLAINTAIPVVVGTGDNVASAFVSGSFENGQPLLSLGTSGVVVIPNRQHQLKDIGKNVVAKIKMGDQTIMTQGTVQAGAKVNSWWLEKILNTNAFSEEQKQISLETLGCNPVMFFPHLNGEKTLYSQPGLRGAFIGLGLETSREEMYLAVLEGLAFGMRQLFEAMKNDDIPEYFTVVGGGTKSDLWLQIFADVFGYPIKRVEKSQEAVHGAALLAIVGTEEAFRFPLGPAKFIEPNKERVQRYEKQYKKYLRLTQLVIDFTKEMENE